MRNAARDHGHAVVVDRQEAVVRLSRDDSAVRQSHPNLTLGKDRQHRFVTSENADFAHYCARNDLLRDPRPDLLVGRDDADLQLMLVWLAHLDLGLGHG